MNTFLFTVNIASVIIGVTVAVLTIYNKRVSTKSKANAFIAHASIMLWCLLLWGDLTGDGYMWQWTASRCICLLIIMVALRGQYANKIVDIFITVKGGRHVDISKKTTEPDEKERLL